MTSRTFWTWSLGVGLAVLPLIGGCLRTAPRSPEIVAASPQPEPASDPAISPPAEDAPAADEQQPASDIADAPVTALSTDKPLPPNIQPTGPLADLIQLASSGVDEGVMLAFVTNSANFFNLRADDIIYLNDIGVPGIVVTAMIHRDEELKGLYADAAAAAIASAPATNASVPVPYAAAPTPIAPAPAPAPVADYASEPEMPPPPPEEVAYPEFYDALSPYGTWVEVGGYGPCWRPSIVTLHPGWQPYFTGGHWLYSECGWYWTSSYTWGWAPFHYGRWFQHHQLGWCWRPDAVWGPSWVCWRHTDTHCGWAPLPPGGRFIHGVGLKGHESHVARLGPESFRFVPWRNFRDPHLEHHVLHNTDAARIYGHTVLSTRIVVSHGNVVNDGVSRDRVAGATRTTVPTVALRDARLPATAGVRADKLERNGRTLTVYRPHPVSFGRTHPTLASQQHDGASGASHATLAPATGNFSPNHSSSWAGGTTATRQAGSAYGTPGARPRWATAQDAGTHAGESFTREDNNARPTQRAPLIIRGPDRKAGTPQIQYPQTAGRSASRIDASQRSQSQTQSHSFAARDDESPSRTDRHQPTSRPETANPSPGAESRFNSPPVWARPSSPQDRVGPSHPPPSIRNAPAEASRNTSWPAERPHVDSTPSRPAAVERSHADPAPAHAAQHSSSAPEHSSHSEPASSHASSPAPASHSSSPAPSSSSSSSSDRGRR